MHEFTGILLKNILYLLALNSHLKFQFIFPGVTVNTFTWFKDNQMHIIQLYIHV